MNLNLDTIILFVQDVDSLKHFYTSILKLEVIEEIPSEWVLLNAGNAKIGLHKAGGQRTKNNEDARWSENNTKIVFEINEDVNKVREWLLTQHIVMKEIKSFENYDYWLCDGQDPEGNVFQLKQRKQ